MDGDGIMVGGRRSEAEELKPIARLGAPRHNCLEEKEEEGEAELLPRLDLLREVPVDGGELRRRRCLGLRLNGEPEGEREEGGVQEDRELTLSTVGRSVEAEVDGRRRNRGRRPAVGGGGVEADCAQIGRASCRERVFRAV